MPYDENNYIVEDEMTKTSKNAHQQLILLSKRIQAQATKQVLKFDSKSYSIFGAKQLSTRLEY